MKRKPNATCWKSFQNVAEGRYSNDILEFTRDDLPESMRTVAEAVSMMMVKVEAREFRLEGLIKELKALNEKIKAEHHRSGFVHGPGPGRSG